MKKNIKKKLIEILSGKFVNPKLTPSKEMYYCSDLGEKTYSKNCEPFDKAKCGEHKIVSEWELNVGTILQNKLAFLNLRPSDFIKVVDIVEKLVEYKKHEKN